MAFFQMLAMVLGLCVVSALGFLFLKVLFKYLCFRLKLILILGALIGVFILLGILFSALGALFV